MRARRTGRAGPALLALAVLAAAGCGNDSPVELGEQLLPGEPVTSFEVVLDADQFLALDSAFALYTNPSEATHTIVANDFAGTLDARALTRFTIVRTITVRDPAGSGTVVDTMPSYFAGRVVLRVDTLRSSHDVARFAVYQLGENWEESSATWEVRVDTGGVTLPWAQPGGTLGPLLAAGEWSRANGDSLLLELDSAEVQTLRDSAIAERGVIVLTETPGARMRLSTIALRADARSSRADTVVTVTGIDMGRTYIFTPDPGVRDVNARVGGVPSWRTLIRLDPDLRDIAVPCPTQPDCTIPLADAEITAAYLEYELATPPPGFVIEDSVRLAALPMFETPGVPFARSLLGSRLQAVASDRAVAPEDFDDVAGAQPVRIPITAAIRSALDEESTPIGIALLAGSGLSTFGFVPLQPEPKLRLILTISQEVQLQ